MYILSTVAKVATFARDTDITIGTQLITHAKPDCTMASASKLSDCKPAEFCGHHYDIVIECMGK